MGISTVHLEQETLCSKWLTRLWPKMLKMKLNEMSFSLLWDHIWSLILNLVLYQRFRIKTTTSYADFKTRILPGNLFQTGMVKSMKPIY